MEVYPIVLVAEREVLVSKEALHEMCCALLRQEADGPFRLIANEIYASDLGQYAILIRSYACIAEELDPFATLQLVAVVVQPGRIVLVTPAEYLIDYCRLLILVAEGKQVSLSTINF